MVEQSSGDAEVAGGARAVAYPTDLARREGALIHQRRQQAVSGQSAADVRGLPSDTVGLAFSGGGIRSATFCLGVLEALSRLQLLRKVDFLSTVSGGGYCGGFLGALLNRSSTDGKGEASGVADVERQLADPHSKVVDWLRENGRYLSPNGAGDAWLAFCVMARNWIAVQTVLLTFVTAVLAAVVAGRVLLAEYCDVRGAEGALVWSPYWHLPAFAFIVATPFAWAYWLVPRVDPGTAQPLSRGPFYRAVLMLLLFVIAAEVSPHPGLGLAVTSVLLLMAIGVYSIAWICARRDVTQKRPDSRVRNVLSTWMALILKLGAATAVVATVDSTGETLYLWFLANEGIGGVGQAVSAIGAGGAATVVRYLVSIAQRSDGKGRMTMPLSVVAGLAALLLGGLTLVVLSAIAHGIAWTQWLVPGSALGSIVALLVGTLAVSILFGRTIRFANDSSHQALYGARLARAYLGASNPARLRGVGRSRSVTEPIAGDDISLDGYAPYKRGGPLHLINVTLNETVSSGSQIQHRDRKGLALAVGPAGLSAGVRHHALWELKEGRVHCDAIQPIAPDEGYQIFVANPPPRVEPLSVATWVSISGAAVAPGLGSRTSLAFSLLLTLFNIRTGYWWDSGIKPGSRPEHCDQSRPARLRSFVMTSAFLVQTHLFYELLARFYGPNRQRWYLTDGGHFENTACYELIRRRVPFIIVCDCGQDDDFEFADVANLVRKARTDFDAEIRFLSRDELKDWNVDTELHDLFGIPADFQPLFRAKEGKAEPTPGRHPCAMLARVDYGSGNRDGQPGSVILFLKPSLDGSEPEDLINYARTHIGFPHESTGDQYFDEAQWESYRKLGETIATRLFKVAAAGETTVPWWPRS